MRGAEEGVQVLSTPQPEGFNCIGGYLERNEKKNIIEELKASCAKLCKRLQGSILYGNDYDSMKDFNNVWLENKSPFPC